MPNIKSTFAQSSMTSPSKLALELVLGRLEATDPPKKECLFEKEPSQVPGLVKAPDNKRIFKEAARDHLLSAARLQAACKLDVPNRTFSLACWNAMLGVYEETLKEALPESNCDRAWGLSELKRVKTLRRQGPGEVSSSLRRALEPYPTVASQIFVLGGGVAGAWQHVNIIYTLEAARQGRINTLSLALSMVCHEERKRLDTLYKLLRYCPGLRGHATLSKKLLAPEGIRILWEKSFPHYWAKLQQEGNGCPRPLCHYLGLSEERGWYIPQAWNDAE